MQWLIKKIKEPAHLAHRPALRTPGPWPEVGSTLPAPLRMLTMPSALLIPRSQQQLFKETSFYNDEEYLASALENDLLLHWQPYVRC